MNYPDSPEGVAFALMMLILSADAPTGAGQKFTRTEIFSAYRECIAVVREDTPPPPSVSFPARIH